jgi:hypothetical protein
MDPRLKNTPPPQPERAPSPSVVGLDEVGDHAKGMRRRRRLRNRVRSGFLVALALTLFGAAAWFGYQLYADAQDQEGTERELRQQQLERERAGETLTDVIDELQAEPAFKGPGVPALGLGTEDP